MVRQVSLIIADMIHNRIEASKLSDIQKKNADKAGTAEGASALMVVNFKSGKIHKRLRLLNEDFDDLLNELEICLIRASKVGEVAGR